MERGELADGKRLPNPLSIDARTKLDGEASSAPTYVDAIVARVNFAGAEREEALPFGILCQRSQFGANELMVLQTFGFARSCWRLADTGQDVGKCYWDCTMWSGCEALTV